MYIAFECVECRKKYIPLNNKNKKQLLAENGTSCVKDSEKKLNVKTVFNEKHDSR